MSIIIGIAQEPAQEYALDKRNPLYRRLVSELAIIGENRINRVCNKQIKMVIERYLRIYIGLIILGSLLLSSCTLPGTMVISPQSSPGHQSSPTTTPQNNPITTAKTYLLTITHTGEGSTTPGSGSYTIAQGQSVTIFAKGAGGWQFDNWSGDVSRTLSSITVMMDSDKNITANFSKVDAYTLTIVVNGIGKVTPSPGIHTYAAGVVVNLIAAPDIQQEFFGWSGAIVQNTPSLSITMNKDMTVTANFSALTYALTIAANGSGVTDPIIGRHTYKPGSVVKISAIPNQGWEFSGWNGSVASPGSATTSVVMDQYQAVTANFTRILFERTVYGPETRKIGAGDTSWTINLIPGDKVDFSFKVSGDKVIYSIISPDGNTLLMSGTPVLTGQNTFTATTSGYYRLQTASTGTSNLTTVTMSYKVYSEP